MNATFSNQSGSGACGSSVSATVTYHDSSPASTPESQSYFAMSWTNYNYIWCMPANEGGCAGDTVATNAAVISLHVDAAPTSIKVINAANNFFGHETCKFFGDGGDGCADAVNYVLKQAVGRTFGARTNWVPSVHDGMLAAGFKPEDQSSAGPGDIAIAGGNDHIGICMTAGCTQIYSNSTSRCAFKWKSDGNFGGNYTGDGKTTYLNWGSV